MDSPVPHQYPQLLGSIESRIESSGICNTHDWSDREKGPLSLGLGSCDADHCTSWQGRRGCSWRSQSYLLFPYTQWEYVSFQIGAIVDYLLSGRGAGGTEFGRGWEYVSAGGATDRVLTVVVPTREGEFSDLWTKRIRWAIRVDPVSILVSSRPCIRQQAKMTLTMLHGFFSMIYHKRRVELFWLKAKMSESSSS